MAGTARESEGSTYAPGSLIAWALGQGMSREAALGIAPEKSEREELLEVKLADLLGRLAGSRPLSIGSLDSHRDARYSVAEIEELRRFLG
jgi:hypothetical protein